MNFSSIMVEGISFLGNNECIRALFTVSPTIVVVPINKTVHKETLKNATAANCFNSKAVNNKH